MAKITTLKDKDNEILYPISVLAAIYKDENQTTEQWLESVLEKMKSDTKDAIDDVNATINNVNTALETFENTSKEKIDYYDTMAEQALAGADEQLSTIVESVRTEATDKIGEIDTLSDEKKTEINTHAETLKDNITTFTDTKKQDISTFSDGKEEEITTLTDTRKQAIDDLADEKEKVITDAADSFTNMTSEYTETTTNNYNSTNASFDTIIEDFQEKADKALDGEHIAKSIKSEDGVHGLRYYDDSLQLDNDGEWDDIISKDEKEKVNNAINQNADFINELSGIVGTIKNRVKNVVYCTCSTSSSTSAKVANIDDDTIFELSVCAIAIVKFTNSNSASNCTLNVGDTGAKSIWYGTSVFTGSNTNVCGYANRSNMYVYDGTYWVWMSYSQYDTDTNTTYSTATSSYNGLMSSSDKIYLDSLVGTISTLQTNVNSATTQVNSLTSTVSTLNSNLGSYQIESWNAYSASGSMPAGAEQSISITGTLGSGTFTNGKVMVIPYSVSWGYTVSSYTLDISNKKVTFDIFNSSNLAHTASVSYYVIKFK